MVLRLSVDIEMPLAGLKVSDVIRDAGYAARTFYCNAVCWRHEEFRPLIGTIE